ncbi:ester cyclase [Microlunatus elymi]|uniref:ester cyclase n=1 Tax=Microlunatus elymi TaxID=2596828 RepID=UPI00224B9259|nr:ester cyclase [Microlunatus elymi]
MDHNKIIHGEPDKPGAAFAAFEQQFAAFDPLQVTAEQTITPGDVVVERLRVAGRHSGSHPRMLEPTGKSFDVKQVWIFTVQDDKITEIRAVSDRLGMFLQLGWDWPTGD